MPKVIRADLPPGWTQWKPDLFPGSEAAFDAGCTCPEHQPWPGAFDFSDDCPIHELEGNEGTVE